MVFETSDKKIDFDQYGFDPNIPLVDKVFKMKKYPRSLHVLYQEDVFAGFFVVFNEENKFK